ncbi:B12-binding domain-containing radical SAM protein [Candidatus Margulisiibacteriota bacterium]
MVDVLLVNPPSPDGEVYIRDINRSGRRSRERTIWPQTSLAYLAAMLRDKYSVGIIDCIAEEMAWPKFKSYIEKQKPKYVIINVITSVVSNDLYTAYLGKFLGATTIAIGPHVTSLPIETLEKFPVLDYAILGEAELTIKELIDICEDNGSLDKVKGIAFRKKGEIKINEKRPLIENLDDLPIPLHELLPIKKHKLPFIGKNYTFVLSSRGCPYSCTFCRQPIMWERRVRSRSAENIMIELRKIKELGIKNFIFHSDTFTINKRLVMELCQKMIEEDLNLSWCCNSRVDTIDEEMLALMKRAGCWMIAFGIETASQEILNNVKKEATVEQAIKAVKVTKEAGIAVWAYFVFGLPGESKETITKSIKLAKKLPVDIANFAIGAPYPGTEFYQQAKNNSWLISDNWEDFDQNYSAIVSYEKFSAKEIKNSIKKAYREWYLRPMTIIRLLTQKNILQYLGVLAKVGVYHLFWRQENRTKKSLHHFVTVGIIKLLSCF